MTTSWVDPALLILHPPDDDDDEDDDEDEDGWCDVCKGPCQGH